MTVPSFNSLEIGLRLSSLGRLYALQKPYHPELSFVPITCHMSSLLSTWDNSNYQSGVKLKKVDRLRPSIITVLSCPQFAVFQEAIMFGKEFYSLVPFPWEDDPSICFRCKEIGYSFAPRLEIKRRHRKRAWLFGSQIFRNLTQTLTSICDIIYQNDSLPPYLSLDLLRYRRPLQSFSYV